MRCARCDGVGWVRETHPELPWEGDRGCPCGAAGAPCPACNPTDDGQTPRIPDDFNTEVDKDGWRH